MNSLPDRAKWSSAGSGQVVETNDGLPFIGESSDLAIHRYRLLRQRVYAGHTCGHDGARPV